MDEFVKKSFDDAMKKSDSAEFDSFKKMIMDDKDIILMSAALSVGMEKMEIFAKVIEENDVEEALNELIGELLTLGFHIGYNEGRLSR